MSACLVLCSGGVDSVTAAALQRSRGDDVHLLHVNYGQVTAEEEWRSVRACADALGIWPPQRVDVPAVRKLGSGTLTGQVLGSDTGPPAEYFPHRNLFLVSVAAMAATASGRDTIVLGAIDATEAHYADCRPAFLAGCSALLSTLDPPLKLSYPLSHMVKGEVVALALQLGVPLPATFSCNRRGGRHCWQCTSCDERKAAFEAFFVPL